MVSKRNTMVLKFEKDYLRQLYETGTISDKKHRFQPEIVRAYAKCLYRLEEAVYQEDLYKYQSMNFEALTGDKQGLYSVRVNKQYRIEFEIFQSESNQENFETVIRICNIIELSNHYK